MSIRPADAADVGRLVAVINQAYRVEAFFVDGDRADAATVARLMESGVFLTGRDGDGPLLSTVYVEDRGRRAYFGLLAVAPAAQRQGWGRRMVAAAESLARGWGASAMDLRVVSLRAELPAFYARLGYVVTGEEPADEPRARRPFHFVRMSKRL
jgi:GNAT superfamily N-acetyltransferase